MSLSRRPLAGARVRALAAVPLLVSALALSLTGTASARAPITATTDPDHAAQIYACDAATHKYVFSRPDALLRTPDGTVIRHGAGPSWTAPDGSRVTGTVVSSTPRTVPDIPTVPELVLRATNDSRPGSFFAGVTTIRRTQTIGGAGITGMPCTPGRSGEIHASYEATYVFE